MATKKPHNKEQQAVWRLECALGVIAEAECPVDGGWSPWSPWSNCHGTCDSVGHCKRTRECNNPPTSKEGTPCNGSDEEIDTCYIKNCSVNDFRECIKGDLIRTEAMHQLEAVPALMKQCLEKECSFESVKKALTKDNAWQLNAETIWNSLQCVKHNIGCPVIGEWGTWGSWSNCGALCGKGFHWRLRRCDTPPPSDARLVCIGNPLQSEECEGDQCAMDGKYSDQNASGIWSNWEKWSACSENCGIGVRRRRRSCVENQMTRISATWGTHCRGQHDQLEVCENEQCLLNGGWSGWSTWGSCSQSCGGGKRFRTRSCTRPIPSGGSNCVGPKSEQGSCHLTPCEVHSHVVALFNGDSFLQYDFPQKRSTLFHSFIRFMPLSPHGSLIRRGDITYPIIRLSLQKWYLCLDARGSSQSCNMLRICSTYPIEPATWLSVMITVNKDGASLRINDALTPIRGAFPCDPELTDDALFVTVGEKFHGVVQELVVNFIPLDMTINNRNRMIRSNYVPSSASNIAYENANFEEAYLNLDNDYYLRLPCFDNQNEWTLSLTIRPKRQVGIILFLPGVQHDHWLCLALLNMRLKVKLSLGDFRSESTSSTECHPGQWLDIVLSKKGESETIEATINGGERLHVLLMDRNSRNRRELNRLFPLQKYLLQSALQPESSNTSSVVNYTNCVLCYDEFYIGSVPYEFKNKMPEDFGSFFGVIAALSVNGKLLDVHSFGIERNKDNIMILSSRTASISGFYHETVWSASSSFNLTCLHARTKRTPNKAWWFFLDTAVNSDLKGKSVKTLGDGRVLRLITTAENNHRGFYTCRAHTNKLTRNVVTYGVIGELQYKLPEPDITTVVAVFTTIALVIATLTWLIIEGINDLRNGYGFFRDAHLSPQEEAEAVCKYIDQNINLFESTEAADIAKARARRKGRYLASKSSFAAQEPEGIIAFQKNLSNLNNSTSSEPEGLPALPEVKSILTDTGHDVYRCEPSYVSSPRHGSNISSPIRNLSSSSSFESSPRKICSRLLITRNQNTSKENSISKRKRHASASIKEKKVLQFPSSACNNSSPAHKILQKFRMLDHNHN
ncbi:unnamed protein product [Parnassius apollo]|uniref:(apollo) hypothetical protein n=1 Tax=Parnassius apollo TaxID=110799 RepID=A0A8S3XVA5_PARAO|nr:unnamed protein product [Parnassius apollo]